MSTSTSPYSLDLREKVIKYIESGNSQQSASKVFELNPSTINRWWRRYKKEGNYLPRKRLGRAPRVSLSAVKSYIEGNPDFKSADMGKHFGMTAGGAFYWLKKLGYSYKKKTLPMWRLTRKSEKPTRKE
jgi:transposase